MRLCPGGEGEKSPVRFFQGQLKTPAPARIFRPFDFPEIVNRTPSKNCVSAHFSPRRRKLDTVPFGRLTALFPRLTQQNIVILLRSLGLFIGQLYQLPQPTQQNHCFVSFAYLTRFLPSQMVLVHRIRKPPRCQLHFRPGRGRRRRYFASSCASAMA